MNIFFLHNNPTVCAMSHNDKHVVKMILETAQLLSSAHHMLSVSPPAHIYKKTHVNHPSAVWVRESLLHYVWTHTLLMELCREYTHRYGRVHKTEESGIVSTLGTTPYDLQDHGWVNPPQCMPDEYKVAENCVQAYRNYYMGGKAHLASWKLRGAPNWCGQQL